MAGHPVSQPMMRKIIFYLALILVVNISFLFSPPPSAEKGPPDLCIYTYVHLGPYMGFPVNCDVFSFLSASANPAILFSPDYIRQSRPGYILLTSVIGYSFYYITWPFHGKMGEILGPHIIGSFGHPEKKVLYGCLYAGAVLINIGILLIALLLLERIAFSDPRQEEQPNWTSRGTTGSSLFPLMVILLLSNPVCKAFFWTVHQQLFTILAPVFCVWLVVSSRKYTESLRSAVFLSLLAGLLLLFYGNFILALPILLFLGWRNVRTQTGKAFQTGLLRLLAVTLSFFSWTILWILFLRLNRTTLYNHEIIHYREFIWIADSLKDSWTAFATKLVSNTRQFLSTMPVLFPTLLLLIILVITRWNNVFRSSMRSSRPIVLIGIEFLLFYWLIGSYFERMTATFNALLICWLTVWLMGQKPDRLLKGFLFIAVLGIHLYWMFSYGPFS